MKSIFKEITPLNLAFYIVFGLLVFSIPVFSYQSKLYLITWVLTVALVAIIAIDIVFIKKRFFVDIVILSLALFCVLAVISSALNRFKGFVFTPLLLCALSIFVYQYVKQNKNLKIKHIFLVSLVALTLFMFVLMIVYRKKIFSFDFSTRLGGELGDENDIAIANALGFALSSYFLLFDKKILLRIISTLLIVLFGICGLTSGSKIFILLVVVAFTFLVAYKNGKKRIWLTFIMLGAFIVAIIMILTIPQFSIIKERFLSFISTLTGISVKNSSANDLSTIYRVNMISNGFQMFLRKPLFGFGIEGFSVYGGMNEGWSHNHFSESLCNFGFLGTIAFHTPIVVSSFSLKKKEKTLRLEPILLLVFFVVCMFSIALFSAKLFSLFSPVMYAVSDYRSLNFSLRKKSKEVLEDENC